MPKENRIDSVEAGTAALEVVISEEDEAVVVVDDPWNAMSAVNAVISPEIAIIDEVVVAAAAMAATGTAAGAAAVTGAAVEAETAGMIATDENVVISKLKNKLILSFLFNVIST